MVDQFFEEAEIDRTFFDASEELKETMKKEPTYEEVMDYLEARDEGFGEWFLRNEERKHGKLPILDTCDNDRSRIRLGYSSD